SDNGRRVVGVEAARADGTRFRVRAGTVVLAAGGIENPRLLLLSDAVHRHGLGNERDVVGRYFMDHPVVRLGEVGLVHAGGMMNTFSPGMVRQRGHRLRGMLRPTRRAQEEGAFLNSLVIFRAKNELPTLGEAVLSLARQTRELVEEPPSPRDRQRSYRANLELVSEPVPDPENRVRLGEERDALGLRRAALAWRLTEREVANFRAVAERLTRSLGEALRGRVRLLMTEEDPWARARWSNHHIGTTRMDPDPARGVVDLDCRVHGVAGLYVAGSSVFPTAGVSNPTYTLIALTLRLADHLKAGVLP
ncbi:MAG: GMC oxidoreductase, partial [Thermoanaerobaculia bacterium]